ncbi:AAA family ATPase [Prescottella equi]|uniref:AAA family ATPase n=1 Tax=Rhodococcus hoagii TaxID=43767 RepID=UPI001F5BAD2C|nr:AAA family ATPase [Prescottella equi]UNQ40227.1 AAA family ATPase [Prescottella equi]
MSELTDEEERAYGRFLAGFRTSTEVLSDASASRWIIPEYVASTATMITGASEAGKTSFVAALVAAIARRDSEFLGQPVTPINDGPVVIITTDPGDEVEWAHRRDELSIPDDRLLIGSFDPANWDLYRDASVSENASLLVFDNITGGLSGALNETDAGEITRPLTGIIRAGVPVLAVHHSAKSGSTDPMGPVAYKAWRRHGIHVDTVGGGLSGRRRLRLRGNQGVNRDVTVDSSRVGEVAYEYRLESDEPAAKPHARSTAKLDQTLAAAKFYIAENLDDLGNKSEAARRIEAQFPGGPTARTWSNRLSRGGALRATIEKLAASSA